MGTATKRNGFLKALKIIGITLVSIVVLAILLVCGATLWLTPERLTRLVNKELSEQLNADITTHNVRFTVWSSFPDLCLEMDSVKVISRNFNGIPANQRALLPADADFLASTGPISGDINVLRLLYGKIALGNVRVDSLSLNLVALDDSLNNYNIIPHKGKSSVPPFSLKFLKLRRPGKIAYTGIADNATADVSLSALDMRDAGEKNLYTLRLRGNADVNAADMILLRNFPFVLDGQVKLDFRPLRVHTDNYIVQLGGTHGNVSLDANLEGEMRLNSFKYNLKGLNPTGLIPFLPMLKGLYPEGLEADLTLNLSAQLTSPYSLTGNTLPSLTVDFEMPRGAIVYAAKGNKPVAINSLNLAGVFSFDGDDPAASFVNIPRLHIRGEGTDINGDIRIDHLTTDPFITAAIRGTSNLAQIASLLPSTGGYTVKGSMKADTKVKALLSGLTDGSLRRLAIEGDLHFPDLNVRNASQGITASLKNATIKCGVDSMMRTARVRLNSGPLSCRYGTTTVNLADADAEFSAKRNMKQIVAKPFVMPAGWNADARTLSFAPHSPHLLKVDVPASLTSLMKDWRTYLSVKSSKGSVRTDGAKHPVSIDKVDLIASFDSLLIRSLAIHSGATAARFSGAVSNLRQFLSSRVPAPIKADINLDIDTVQINQLARNYYHPRADQATRDTTIIADDTVSMLIPRNIFANVHVSAMQTRYMNLHLYDLNTDLHLADGRVDVDSLHISAEFGHAGAAMFYDTSDMQKMAMNCNVEMLDVDVVKFFKNFHQLLVMMPQMKNLSGYVSAECSAGFMLFPNMYVNVPSLQADIDLQGRDLQVHQNKFIRRISRMLLLPKGVLHIADMNVHADIRDNLVKLYPFKFDVSKYSLTMMGLNNFDGQIYYHIGVDKSPLHIPFGINIRGDFHKPHISFGGRKWKDKNGAEITAGVMDYNAINIMQEGRKYIHEFLSHAAAYEGE